MKTDAEKVRFNKKSVENLDFTSSVPQRTQEQDRIIASIRKEMTEHDQQMFLTLLTVTYFADTLEDLALETDALKATAANYNCRFTELYRCKAMDSYHRALIYTLTAVPALRNNIESCFGFERDEIKPESLAAGWQTTGTTKLTRFAYNLWNGYDDKSCTPYELFDCSFAPYMYEAVKLRYPEHTRQLDDVVIDDARN